MDALGRQPAGDFLGSGKPIRDLDRFNEAFLHPSLHAIGKAANRRVARLPGELEKPADGFSNRLEKPLNGVGLYTMDCDLADHPSLVLGKDGLDNAHERQYSSTEN